ncbi:DUF6506 family protein [Pendulispora albinea]|uniref:DUF6506 family protein n=1 Tax=Pendulispora albinea TaxID=2741071 RepID=A0ABZ2M7T3_9BACT
MISSWGFIYLGPGSDPATNRVVLNHDGLETTLVAVPTPEGAAQVAVGLVEGGVQLIELCGALGPTIAAKVIEATGGRVPVGVVAFGVESIGRLAALV